MMGTRNQETGGRGIRMEFPRVVSPSSMFLLRNRTTMAGDGRMDVYYGCKWALECYTATATVGRGGGGGENMIFVFLSVYQTRPLPSHPLISRITY